MKPDLCDIERFYGGPRPTWTDFLKEKDLRMFIKATEERLKKLSINPEKNREGLIREQVILRAAQRELEQLRNRLDYF